MIMAEMAPAMIYASDSCLRLRRPSASSETISTGSDSMANVGRLRRNVSEKVMRSPSVENFSGTE